MAVDPARFGPDSTMLGVRRGPVLERLVGWHGLDTMQTVERVVAELSEVGIHEHRGRVVVDGIGIGAGIVDRLRQLRYTVVEFNGGSRAWGARFMNRRAESYWTLRKRLEEGSIAIPSDEKLFDELLAIQWRETPEGKVRIEEKREIKGRLGRSPDRADVLAMAFGEIGREAKVVEFLI